VDVRRAAADSGIDMTVMEISNRLSQARQACGEDLAALGARIGVRQEHLRAIEDGRFADLPPGIYGRAAVRTFAGAMGFDGAAVLAECEPFLVPVDEPIAALARLRGVRARRPEPSRSPSEADAQDDFAGDSPFAGWRRLAAAALDACVVAGLLLMVIVSALTALTAPVSALKDSAPAFGLMGLLLAAAYFLCFGGVRGVTVGARALGVARDGHASTVTLQLVLERAMLSATEDLRCMVRMGERLGRSTAAWVASASGAVKG
jgi:hypothetical protein